MTDNAERRAKLKREILGIATRPNAVRFSEISGVVSRLERLGFQTSTRRTNETHLFTIRHPRYEVVRFGVCDHHRGSQHVLPCYVKAFLRAMNEIDLFGGDDDEDEDGSVKT